MAHDKKCTKCEITDTNTTCGRNEQAIFSLPLHVDHSQCLLFSLFSYPMFPLQVVTDTSIVTKGNISYSKHTGCVAAENDHEYTYIAVPQPSLCKLTYINQSVNYRCI